MDRESVNYAALRARADIGGYGVTPFPVGAGAPDTIAPFAIRAARTDIGGTGGRPPGGQLSRSRAVSGGPLPGAVMFGKR